MIYNHTVSEKDESYLLSRTYYRLENHNLPVDLTEVRELNQTTYQKIELFATEEDLLEERMNLELDQGELNFRHLLYDCLYDVREWIKSSEGLDSTLKTIVERYDISLLTSDELYVWCQNIREADYVYLTELLLNAITPGVDWEFGGNIRKAVNQRFRNEFNVPFPLLPEPTFRVSLKYYAQTRLYGVKNQITTSMSELRKMKKFLMKHRLEDTKSYV